MTNKKNKDNLDNGELTPEEEKAQRDKSVREGIDDLLFRLYRENPDMPSDMENMGSGSGMAMRTQNAEVKREIANSLSDILVKDNEKEYVQISHNISKYQLDFLNGLVEITGTNRSQFIRGLIDIAINNMGV